ncbi:WxL domain-containing protein [Vagococcus lutrae]|uniref:WxL domain-containing protein n=1 Tax=Vagococcus lutrae TaxID=81947 RepID=UPI00200F6D2E|nr:WxL domain-containing protein [Vagococcus lutrae]UQF70302.1 WxL domain-containing protein [Vagococcus lutrae]
MKKLTANLLIASTILGSIAAPIVKAEEGETANEVKNEANTTANVQFTANDEGETTPVDPVDPENPTGPGGEIDPENPTGPENPGGQGGDKGALRIDWAPHFNFGENKIKGGGDFVIDATHYVNEETNKPIHYFVQVSDLRGLDGANWKLDVTASPLTRMNKPAETKEDDQNNQLLNSYITFKRGNVSNGLEDQKANTDNDNGVKFATTKIELGPKEGEENKSQTLINAENKQNPRGTWSLAMERNSEPYTDEESSEGSRTSDVTLTIPASQVKKIRKATYQATLNWELSSTVKPDTKGLLPVAK